MVCANGNRNPSWFWSDGKNKTYIKKKDRALAEQLAYKKYLTLELEGINQELLAIRFYLRHHHEEIPKSSQLITESSEYQNLLSSYYTPLVQEFKSWMEEAYEKNKAFPQQLIHKTSSGEYVRSKSEAIILTYLHRNRIPFRYECELKLGVATIYPDFTIRHPRTGEIYYWEHFGLMDNNEYARNTFSKLSLYQSHGVIPTINLITTYETREHPLSIDTVEKIIEEYFL